jgi:hypothetical protein
MAEKENISGRQLVEFAVANGHCVDLKLQRRLIGRN